MRLATAITFGIGVLAVVGGIAQYAGHAAGASGVEAIVDIVFGLACLVVGYRVKSGTARRSELVVLAVVMAILVVADAWVSASAMHLFGLAAPAVLLLLLGMGVVAKRA